MTNRIAAAARVSRQRRLAPLLFAIAVTGANAYADERLPSDVLDLRAWKLTLPYDTRRSGDPDEVRQPELDRFQDRQCFFVPELGDFVIFRAACDGQQTKNSKYPRTELREMDTHGKKRASWGTNDGQIHTLEVKQAVTHLPSNKPHVVCAQIHDKNDDLLMVRLNAETLFLQRAEESDVPITSDYQLGDVFTLKIVAGGGHVSVWYNGDEVMDWRVARKGCYFKVGCYTQSNRATEQDHATYGEVKVYRIKLSHADDS